MDLKKKVIVGLRWTALASVAATVLGFVKIVLLARILSPRDFGLAAIVMAILGVLQTFSDAGISAAIVQREQISQKQYSALYWLTIYTSLIVAAVYLLATPLITGFYNDPDLRGLLYLSASILVIWAVGLPYQMLIQRRLGFGTMATIDVVSAMANAGAAVTAALMGLGATAIIVGHIAGAALRSGPYLVIGGREFRPALVWHMRDAAGFIGFGLYQMGDRFVRNLASRIDQLLIGKLLGATELGYYNLAYNLVLQPITRVAPIVGRVTFPVYARMQQDLERLRKAYYKVLQSLATLLFPLLVFLAIFAEPVVLALYGAKWEPAVILVRILAIAAAFWTVDYPVGMLQVSLGRVGLSFVWSLIILALTGLAVVVGAGHGLAGVAVGIVMAWALVYVGEYPLVVRQLIGPGAREYFIGALGIPFTASAIAGLAAYAVTLVIDTIYLRLGMALPIYLLLYVAIARKTAPKITGELLHAITGKGDERRE